MAPAVPPRIAVTVVLAVLAGTTPASASVVTSARSFQPGFTERVPKFGLTVVPARTSYVLAIAAAPGEANAVVVELTAQGFVVRDAAGITAGEGCTAADATTATCSTAAEPGSVVNRSLGTVTLGDGDDAVAIPPDAMGLVLSKVDGGSGDDTITGAGTATGGPGDDHLDAQRAEGGPGDDVITAREADGGDGNDTIGPNGSAAPVTLRGGAGDDVLTGGPGGGGGFVAPGDVLDGGEGDDRLDAGDGQDRLLPGSGADVIDGGRGADVVSFAYASVPVRADLAAGPVDPTGEGDAMTAVESVEGGSGDDVLLGTADDSLLLGGGGNDHLEGRGGRDLLIGGAGADVVDGGDGDDDVAAEIAFPVIGRQESAQHAPDAAADRATGGAGDDVVRVGGGDRADGGPGDDLVVAGDRPAAARCGPGSRDTFDGRALPRDCERIAWFGTTSVPVPAATTLRRGRLALRVPGHFGGRVTVAVHVDGRRVAGGDRRLEADSWETVRLPVTPRGQRLLRGARSMRVDVLAPGGGGRRERDTTVFPPPR